jgi:hypothetical protein
MKTFDINRTVDDYEEECFKELELDKYKLDEEYETQPQLYLNWSKLYAVSLAESKRISLDLERVKADVDLEIRTYPDKYELPKITETAIHSIMIRDDRVKIAEERNIKIIGLMNFFAHAVRAFEQRKELLKGKGELWKGGYYSTVSPVKVREEGEREIEKEKMNEEVGETVPRVRRKKIKIK